MATHDTWTKLAAALAALALAAGCGSMMKGDADLAEKGPEAGRLALLGQMPWVPLSLSRESFIAAEQRLNKDVQVGMPRAEFLRAMKLSPVGEGDNQLVMGDGWLTDISSRNTVGGSEIEEYPFGYMEKYQLKERFAVILEQNRVSRIVRSAWAEGHSGPQPPAELTSKAHPLAGENRMVAQFYRASLQSRSAFEQVLPHLKRIRPGWTSAEVRLALGGSMYRLSNGYVYLQEGLLWDQGFSEQSDGGSQIVILPFGYRSPDGQARTEVIVRAENGVVTAVFWQGQAAPASSSPAEGGRAPASR
ncbi:MAG: hypothetical protein AABZ64_07905 [Nitrospinota bacterium]